MTEAIVVALITGGLSLAGVVITCIATAKKTEQAAATKIEELTREVREHNNFARRMPAVETRVTSLETRVTNLEQYHKAPIN